MFFPNKLAAIKEAARVLKPGSKFYFNIWDSYDHNDFIRVVNDELRAIFPDAPPDFFNTPYGYHRIDEVRALIAEAGFGDVNISILPRSCTADVARDVALGYVLGTPVRLQIVQKDSVALEKVVDRVEDVVANHFGNSPSESKMQAVVFSAQLPT